MSELTQLKEKILKKEKLDAFEVMDIIYSRNIPIIEKEVFDEEDDYAGINLIIDVDGQFFKIFYWKGKSILVEDSIQSQTAKEVELKEVLIKQWAEKE